MILIDSVYINDGGGLVLLKYLVDVLGKTELSIFYLFDERTKDIFKDVNSSKLFVENKISKRKKFYDLNKNKFSSVLCFGNVPPPIKLEIPVMVYFHQPLVLKIPSEFSLKNKVIYGVKQLVLNYYKNNATIWLTQSKYIQENLARKYFSGSVEKIKVMPFYPPIDCSEKEIIRGKANFIYVSNAAPHKNHRNLILAFCAAYDKIGKGTLTVTVPSTAVEVCKLIDEKIDQGYPIENIGFIDRKALVDLYLSSEYLIFPSLAESFGLGLAEAIDAGCKVIASDLAYTYQVCNPSLTFNPYIIQDMEAAIITAVTEDLPSSQKNISNDIEQLISILSG